MAEEYINADCASPISWLLTSIITRGQLKLAQLFATAFAKQVRIKPANWRS